MLKFFVFEQDALQPDDVLRHAHLLAPDNMLVAGAITFEGRVITCEKTNRDAVALGLQVSVTETPPVELPDGDPAAGFELPGPPPGVLTLQTCLLPERDRPYLLSIELARHRAMLFYNKLEAWQISDLQPDDPIMKLFEQGRLLFTHALSSPRTGGEETFGYTREANALAYASLCALITASEMLAIEEVRRRFVPRVKGEIYAQAVEHATAVGRPPARPASPAPLEESVGVALASAPLVGCTISPTSFTDSAQAVAAESFDFVSMPMRWVEMEPTEGRYAFQATDRWIEWAVRKAKLPVVAGPLLDFKALRVPDWLYIWENDYETLRDYVHEHIKNLVTRYRRTIGRWTVVSGIHVNGNFHFSFDQMMDLTRRAVTQVRKLDPTAKILIEIDQPWGEYYTDNRHSLPPMLYADAIASQAGLIVDGFGLRVQMGQSEAGRSTRDLMAFSAMLDRYALTERPISITAMGAPSAPIGATSAPELAGRSPGHWHSDWTEGGQADWAAAYMAVAASKPFVQSICWQDLYDVPDPVEMPKGGLISVSGEAKPTATRIRELMKAIHDKTAAPLPERFAEGVATRR